MAQQQVAMDTSERTVDKFWHTTILEDKRDILVAKMNLEDDLINKLISAGILREGMDEDIKAERTPRKRVAALLDKLKRRPLEDYLKFRQCLVNDNQGFLLDFLPDEP